jgi:hypothetical protein
MPKKPFIPCVASILALVAGIPLGSQEIAVYSDVDVPVPRPKAAAIRDGFVLTWNDGAGRRYGLDGTPRGSFQAGRGYYNDVAGNETAGFVVAWWDWDEARSYAQRFDAEASPVGESFALSPPPDADARNLNPVVAVNRQGAIAACWKRWIFDDDPRNAFFARVIGPDGTDLVPTFKVADFIGIHEYPAAIAMNDAGEFAIAWESAPVPSTYYHVYVQLFAPDGTPIGDPISLGQGNNPGIAMNLDGFVVTLSGLLRSYDLQGLLRYESPLEGSADTSVAMNPAGAITAVWDDWTGNQSRGIFAQNFDADGAAGAPYQVNEQTGGMFFEPRVAMSERGEVVLAWPRESIIEHHFTMDVFARVFEPEVLFVRGDVNGDAYIDISDPILTLLFMFDIMDLYCRDAADVDDNGRINILDPLMSLLFIFTDASPPPPPFPDPGVDPTDDTLGCAWGL